MILNIDSFSGLQWCSGEDFHRLFCVDCVHFFTALLSLIRMGSLGWAILGVFALQKLLNDTDQSPSPPFQPVGKHWQTHVSSISLLERGLQ